MNAKHSSTVELSFMEAKVEKKTKSSLIKPSLRLARYTQWRLCLHFDSLASQVRRRR